MRGIENTAEKQNVGIFGNNRIGVQIGVHAAVVEFDPLIAIIRPAVRVVVASAVTKKMSSVAQLLKGQAGTHPPV